MKVLDWQDVEQLEAALVAIGDALATRDALQAAPSHRELAIHGMYVEELDILAHALSVAFVTVTRAALAARAEFNSTPSPIGSTQLRPVIRTRPTLATISVVSQ